MAKKLKIFIAGHKGMVGSSILRKLKDDSQNQIITRERKDLDLTNQNKVNEFFRKEKPDQVYLAAAKVGGIYANNSYPAEFIYENIMIQNNIIHSSFLNGTKKLLFLGSSCIYPKFNHEQIPIKENSLLSGKLEPTNEPYAVAKISGIKLCESYNRQYGLKYGIDYRSIMPTNLYGQGDNYHPENSHVMPALILRFHNAKIKNKKNVNIWGTGNPKREFLYVDDMSSACIHLMNIEKKVLDKYTTDMLSHVNVGCGKDISIKELAQLIAKIIGYKGVIINDLSKPDGAPRKLLDCTIINKLGWYPKISLEEGIKKTYNHFLKNKNYVKS